MWSLTPILPRSWTRAARRMVSTCSGGSAISRAIRTAKSAAGQPDPQWVLTQLHAGGGGHAERVDQAHGGGAHGDRPHQASGGPVRGRPLGDHGVDGGGGNRGGQGVDRVVEQEAGAVAPAA